MIQASREIGETLEFNYDIWEQTFVLPRVNGHTLEGPIGLDLSETYILHAYHSQFGLSINSNPDKLSQGLTLPLVLEGTSHFSRAVLHSVQHAVDHGVISVTSEAKD